MKRILTILSAAYLIAATSCTVISPVTATNNPIGDAVGKSSTKCFFPFTTSAIPSGAYAGKGFNIISSGMCTNKDYGVIEAADKGKLERIATVDLKKTNYVLFTKFEIIVTGE